MRNEIVAAAKAHRRRLTAELKKIDKILATLGAGGVVRRRRKPGPKKASKRAGAKAAKTTTATPTPVPEPEKKKPGRKVVDATRMTDAELERRREAKRAKARGAEASA
jgi:hypothetical protein